jgi:hypothetical protein
MAYRPNGSRAAEIPREIAPEISLQDAAARLDKHFHTPEAQPEPSTAQPTPEYPTEEDPGLGDVLDLVVVAWKTADPTGRSRGSFGLARIQRSPTRRGGKRTDGCFFKDCDIISTGVETLRPGSRIRARLSEAISTAHPFTLKDVEIFKD